MHISSRSRVGLSLYSYGQPCKQRRSAWSFWFGFLLFAGLAAAIPLMVIAGINYRTGAILKDKPSLAAASVHKTPQVSPEAKMSVTTPEPAAKVQTISDPGLRDLLIKWASAHPRQQWSVVVDGLDYHTPSASINPDIIYDSASVYKLFLTYPLLQKADISGLKTTDILVNGKATKLSDCVELMLKVSNNECGASAGDWVGWSRSSQALKNLGMKSTNMNNSGGPVTTAADTALFLKALNSGPAFSSDGRQYVLDILKQQSFRSGIPAGCKGCTVADKTGDMSYIRHDAGIVEYPGGKYSLSILTNGVSYYQIAQLTTQIQNYINTKAP